MVFADDQRAGQFALGARGGLQGNAGKSTDLLKPFLQGVHQVEVALNGIFRLAGMGQAKACEAAGDFVDLGVVLHCTGTQGVKAEVDGVVKL